MNKRQARDLAGLLHIAGQKNYPHKWVLRAYLERFGEWPPYDDVEPWPLPEEPTKALLEFVRKRGREYRKTQERSHKTQEKSKRRKEIKQGSPRRQSLFGQMYAHMRSIKKEGT